MYLNDLEEKRAVIVKLQNIRNKYGAYGTKNTLPATYVGE